MFMELEGEQYTDYNFINREITRFHLEIREVEQKIYIIQKSGFLKRLLSMGKLRELKEERKFLLRMLSNYLQIDSRKCSL